MSTVKTDLGDTEESARRERFEPTAGVEATNVQKAIEELVFDIASVTFSAQGGSPLQIANIGDTAGLVTFVNPSTSTFTTRSIVGTAGQITIVNAAGSGGDPTISIANTTITAGTYGGPASIPVFIVDAQGRLTSAANTAASGVNVGNTVGVLVQATPGVFTVRNLSVSVGQLVLTNASGSNADPLFGLANSGVTAGTYGSSTGVPVLTLDSFGRINSAGTASISAAANLGSTVGFVVQATPGVFTSRNLSVSVGQLVLTNASGSNANPLFGLANSGVTATTYGTPNLTHIVTVDAFGRITNAATTGLYNVSVTSGELSIINLGRTDSSQNIGLANSGVTAGTYGSSGGVPVITIDRFGRINSAGTGSISGGSAATQAQMEAGTDTVTFASPQNIKYAPGVVKAWVYLNQSGALTINASHNVSSVTDNGTGDATVNFTIPFSSSSYFMMCNAMFTNNSGAFGFIPFTSIPTSSACRFNTTNLVFAVTDCSFVNCMFMGDQ